MAAIAEPLSADERAALGRKARERAKRSSHARWEPPADRPSPRRILAQQDASRVSELVPIRYGRMLVSPFTFYRGAAAIMASDLASTQTSGFEAQLCGDAHLSNFGVFAAPDRRLVFDVNDFDETLPGPFEWDVKRMAASFAIAGRDRGFGAEERRRITLASVTAYRNSMREFAGMSDLGVWYARADLESALEEWRADMSEKEIKRYEKGLAKARHKDSKRALDRLSRKVDGKHRIVSDPPLIVPIEELAPAAEAHEIDEALRGLIGEYRETLTLDRRLLSERFTYLHAARKVVGVGSVGTRAWIILLTGRDADDPLFLQAKEADRSVLEPYLRKSRFQHQGRRVVEGQRLMQAASDIFLGWMTSRGDLDEKRDYYVRQLWDGKRSVDVELLPPRGLVVYAQLCGWTLARAHARSGDRIAIAAYLGGSGTFDDAVAEFAEAYADQNERDYRELTAAVDAGEIAVERGV
jgi:uncharacterized protein (DUF2252 family)